MLVGVISHLDNPTVLQVSAVARAAESAGADWLGLPDAFWWRDTWVLAAEAARRTVRLGVGPLVTNPYLRHPFHTVAALATLQDFADSRRAGDHGDGGTRVRLGLAAGGSEVTGAAGIPRDDAPVRIERLARLVRQVAAGAPLDEASGRKLEVPLTRPPILVAGRAATVLRVAGRVADEALLWMVPRSDLARSAALIGEGGERKRFGRSPRWPTAGAVEPTTLVWAPAVAHDEDTRKHLLASAPYAVLNSRVELQQRWSLDESAVAAIRRSVLAGDGPAASARVPRAALEDLILEETDPAAVAALARNAGVGALAVPVFDVASVPDRVAWARAVTAAMEG